MSSVIVKIMKPGVMKQSNAKPGQAPRPYCAQAGYAQLYDRNGELEDVPRRIEFMCDKPMTPGDYTLSPKSFGVGQYDRLEMRRLILEPVVKGK